MRWLGALRRLVSAGRRSDGGFPPGLLARFERQRAERERLRARDPVLFDAYVAAFFRVDPAGVNYEINTDEYEGEVGTVLARMPSAKSLADVERIVHEELTDWFGDGVFVEARVAPLAADLWTIWQSRPLS